MDISIAMVSNHLCTYKEVISFAHATENVCFWAALARKDILPLPAQKQTFSDVARISCNPL